MTGERDILSAITWARSNWIMRTERSKRFRSFLAKVFGGARFFIPTLNRIFRTRIFAKRFKKACDFIPAAPVEDGNYVAVIVPKDSQIKDIIVQDSPLKSGVPEIAGITIESGEKIGKGIALSGDTVSRDFAKFVSEKPLCPAGEKTKRIHDALKNLDDTFYQNDKGFKRHVAEQIPPGYSGPTVSFRGDIFATILENAYYANVQDMRNKITEDGMYHTSTMARPTGASMWASGPGGLMPAFITMIPGRVTWAGACRNCSVGLHE